MFVFLQLFLLLFFNASGFAQKVEKPVISAENAISIVKNNLSKFRTGNVKISEGRSGIKSINVSLLFEDKVITEIRVNPENGEIIPKGYRTYYPKVLVSESEAVNIVNKALSKVKIGNPWLSVDKKWRVPLVLNNSIIAEVSVDGKSGKILGKVLTN
jgi:uncharacterized membrane protein YkoI